MNLVWHDDPVAFVFFRAEHPFFLAMSDAITTMWISGWAVLVTSSFLLGIKKQSGKPTFHLMAALLLASPLVTFSYEGFRRFYFDWDVYPFLAGTFLLFRGASKIQFKSAKIQLAVVSVLLFATLIPFNSYKLPGMHFLNAALFGGCLNSGSGFPLLPFSLLLLAFDFAGDLYANHARGLLKRISWPEIVLWGAGLSISAFYLYKTPFRLELLTLECQAADSYPYHFWACFIWVVFCIRLSLIETVERSLFRRFHFLSRLAIARDFGLLYITNYLLSAMVAATMKGGLREDFRLYFVFALASYPISEMIIQGLRKRESS